MDAPTVEQLWHELMLCTERVSGLKTCGSADRDQLAAKRVWRAAERMAERAEGNLVSALQALPAPYALGGGKTLKVVDGRVVCGVE